MDFGLANQYAERIRGGEIGNLRQELVATCIPYLLSLRKRLGFHHIPVREVLEELASDAVSDAIMEPQRRKLPFTICLHNTFRDGCRQRERILRERYIGDLVTECEAANSSSVIGVGTQPSLPDVQAQQNEEVTLAGAILDGHPPFSKKLVYQRARGSTYPEMAEIFNSTVNECKRVYWHDMNDIRKKLNPSNNDDWMK